MWWSVGSLSLVDEGRAMARARACARGLPLLVRRVKRFGSDRLRLYSCSAVIRKSDEESDANICTYEILVLSLL